MSLFTRNNLLDLTDIAAARRNLMLGDCADLSSAAVDLVANGGVQLNRLFMKSYDSNQDVFLRRSSNGEVYIDATSNIQSWVRPRTEDIPLTVFANDVDAVYTNEVVDLIYTADYLHLSRRPTLQRILTDHFGEDPLCVESLHLNDIDANIRDSVHLELGLNPYAMCNYDSRSSFADVRVANMRLKRLTGRPGVITNGGNDVVGFADAIGATADIELHGLTRVGADVFDNDTLASIRSNVIERAENKITFYQSNVDTVEEYLQNNTGAYVLAASNLSDVSTGSALALLELDAFKNNVSSSGPDALDIGELNMLFIPNELDLFVDSLIAPLLTKYPFYTYRHFKYAFIFTDSDGNIDMQDQDSFPAPTATEIGVVKVKRDLTNATDPEASVRLSYIHERNVIHLERMRTALDNIDLYRVLDAIYEENLIANTRLLRNNRDLEEMASISSNDRLACFSNLGISAIVSTLDYADLSRIPTTNACFDNDMGFGVKTSNLGEWGTSGDLSSCRANLGLGSVCLQNVDTFELYGTTLETDFVAVIGSLRMTELGQSEGAASGAIPFESLQFIHTNTLYMTCGSEAGACVWNGLPETSHGSPDVHGVVRMHSSVRYDEEGTYTTDVLRSVYEEIHNAIQLCRADAEELLANVQ